MLPGLKYGSCTARGCWHPTESDNVSNAVAGTKNSGSMIFEALAYSGRTTVARENLSPLVWVGKAVQDKPVG